MWRYLSALFFVVIVASTAIAGEEGTGRLSGAWVPRNMGPVSGGLVRVFNAASGSPPSKKGARRVPDAIAVTDEKGKFSLDLPEGTYYLSLLKRPEGAVPGPPQEGDLHALSRDKHRKPIIYKVKRGKTTDVGILRQGTSYTSPAARITAGMTAIAGTVKAFDGSPLGGVIVQVYGNQEVSGKPLYVSEKTGKDGLFVVLLDDGGTYYITVRDEYGAGRPETGDVLGVYGGDMAKPVTVKKQGVIKGIDIQVGQFVSNRPN